MVRRRRRQAWIVRAGCVVALLCGPATERLIAPAPVLIHAAGTPVIEPRPPLSPSPLPRRASSPHRRTARATPAFSPSTIIVTPLASLPGMPIDPAAPSSSVLPSRLRMPSHVAAIEPPPTMPIVRTPLHAPRVLRPLYV